MWGILGSILSGGATGLLGVGIQKLFDFKTKKLELDAEQKKFEHEVALRRVDAEIMQQEWASRTKVAEVEASAKVEVEDAKAFATALTSEPKMYSEGTTRTPAQVWMLIILDFLRGIVRPGLTIYLCFITTVIYYQANKLLNTNLILPTMAYDLVNQIVQTVLYLTTTCVLFWFGARNHTKGPK